VPHARSSSSSLVHLISSRPDARAHAAVCGIEPRSRVELSLGAELIFLLHRKTERLTESLTVGSGLPDRGLL
jgi:hypothetical protein